MRVGINLRRVRERKSIPLKTAAMCLGVRMNTVAEWERGEHEMTLTKFLRFCDVLGCSPSEVL